MSVKAIVMDIEGTTTSIDFVTSVLFPYAAMHLKKYINNNYMHNKSVQDILEKIREEIGEPSANIDNLTNMLLDWIDQDKKITALKDLQGLMWEAGYKQGDFTGHLYPDVVEMLPKWQDRNIDLYIFSSGSIKAQKLLFQFSDFGDLTGLIKGYFDTNIGHKRDPKAYRKIAESIGLSTAEILFLSDTPEELDAAQKSNMLTTLLIRGDQLKKPQCHPVVNQFKQIALGA